MFALWLYYMHLDPLRGEKEIGQFDIVGGAKVVKKVEPSTKSSLAKSSIPNYMRPNTRTQTDPRKRTQTVAELANTYVKMMSRPNTNAARPATRSKSRSNKKTPAIKKNPSGGKVGRGSLLSASIVLHINQ